MEKATARSLPSATMGPALLLSLAAHALLLGWLFVPEPPPPGKGRGTLQLELVARPKPATPTATDQTLAPLEPGHTEQRRPSPTRPAPAPTMTDSARANTVARKPRPVVDDRPSPAQRPRVSRPPAREITAVAPIQQPLKSPIKSPAEAPPPRSPTLPPAAAQTAQHASPAASAPQLAAPKAAPQPRENSTQAVHQARQKLAQALAGHFSYPIKARRKHWEGEVILRVTLARNGRIGAARVDRSSGYPLLDQAALASLQKVEHLTGLTLARDIELLLPVVYRLKG
ncbi:energy transducer TonB [Motiliproteus sp. SC1-56]|uniref:energy transducer TonB n=1 Tax=Motiliproteus sp. SC1-56 TaxID=2799565 RepID=UPI001A90AFA7|nr:energy transducer TonB [Motiliproteus sp. SC1-56]